MNGIQQNNGSQMLHMPGSLQLSQFSGELPAVKLGVQAAERWPQSRRDRLAALRTQVEAGTYQIDNQELARCILINETRLFSVQAH